MEEDRQKVTAIKIDAVVFCFGFILLFAGMFLSVEFGEKYTGFALYIVGATVIIFSFLEKIAGDQ